MAQALQPCRAPRQQYVPVSMKRYTSQACPSFGALPKLAVLGAGTYTKRAKTWKSMKAAYINQTGTPDVITYGDRPTSKPNRRKCLIKVTAVHVTPIDVYIRNGAIPAKMPFPLILGRY